MHPLCACSIDASRISWAHAIEPILCSNGGKRAAATDRKHRRREKRCTHRQDASMSERVGERLEERHNHIEAVEAGAVKSGNA